MENQERILIKYGGNAMKSERLQKAVIQEIKKLKDQGYTPILVHGGGPYIEQFLNYGKIPSEFIQGLRYTSEDSIPYLEAALRGFVNGGLTGLGTRAGMKTIGLSGKDGGSVICTPKKVIVDEKERTLGRVGEVAEIDTTLYELLLRQDYMLMLCSVAMDREGYEYNVNADTFAGAMAAALNVDHFLVLTNTDGLLEDPDRPDSLIHEVTEDEVTNSDKIKISEGMMPKMEACIKALHGGVKNVRIINGQKPEIISEAILEGNVGTQIMKTK